MKTEKPSEIMRLPSEFVKALVAIAEGYPLHTAEDNFIIVENPDFEEDNGKNPYLVIDVSSVR